jgi:hypothetical protein
MLANNAKVVKQQLICNKLNYNKNDQLFLTKVTNDYNKKSICDLLVAGKM